MRIEYTGKVVAISVSTICTIIFALCIQRLWNLRTSTAIPEAENRGYWKGFYDGKNFWSEETNSTKSISIPIPEGCEAFDLRKALDGAKLRTRSGLEVRGFRKAEWGDGSAYDYYAQLNGDGAYNRLGYGPTGLPLNGQLTEPHRCDLFLVKEEPKKDIIYVTGWWVNPEYLGRMRVEHPEMYRAYQQFLLNERSTNKSIKP